MTVGQINIKLLAVCSMQKVLLTNARSFANVDCQLCFRSDGKTYKSNFCRCW